MRSPLDHQAHRRTASPLAEPLSNPEVTKYLLVRGPHTLLPTLHLSNDPLVLVKRREYDRRAEVFVHSSEGGDCLDEADEDFGVGVEGVDYVVDLDDVVSTVVFVVAKLTFL
uniref:Uncharacterized protein n=1 Tax=Cannabis sativa TaxID=3483 RepID=A0A803PVP5_CANSA